MPLHPLLAVLCLPLALCACAHSQDQRVIETTNEPVPAPEPVSLEGWASETIELPPGFAPDLPKGVELLRFAPGWRDPSSANFWSYAMVMRINEAAPDAERIGELLETYYTGLMLAFGVDESDAQRDPVRVEVVRTGPNRFEATMRLIDGFATFKPIDLRVVIVTAAESDVRSSVQIQLSPQPKEHHIWRSLEAAISNILS